jgi:hypothetical protein
MGMEMSKSKNYLSRINYLFREHEEKFSNIRKEIGKISNK